MAYIIFLKQSIEVSGRDWNLSVKILQYSELLGKAFLKLQFLEPWEKNGISISFFKKKILALVYEIKLENVNLGALKIGLN